MVWVGAGWCVGGWVVCGGLGGVCVWGGGLGGVCVDGGWVVCVWMGAGQCGGRGAVKREDAPSQCPHLMPPPDAPSRHPHLTTPLGGQLRIRSSYIGSYSTIIEVMFNGLAPVSHLGDIRSRVHTIPQLYAQHR